MPLVPCPECGWNVSSRATSCPQCGCPMASAQVLAAAPPAEPAPQVPAVKCEHWRSSNDSWDTMFNRAKEKADLVGPQRLISISHSLSFPEGIVAVWYWTGQLPRDWPGRTSPSPKGRTGFHVIDSAASWEIIFAEAAEFATKIGPERLIGIWHTQGNVKGVVTVWYWLEEGAP